MTNAISWNKPPEKMDRLIDLMGSIRANGTSDLTRQHKQIAEILNLEFNDDITADSIRDKKNSLLKAFRAFQYVAVLPGITLNPDTWELEGLTREKLKVIATNSLSSPEEKRHFKYLSWPNLKPSNATRIFKRLDNLFTGEHNDGRSLSELVDEARRNHPETRPTQPTSVTPDEFLQSSTGNPQGAQASIQRNESRPETGHETPGVISAQSIAEYAHNYFENNFSPVTAANERQNNANNKRQRLAPTPTQSNNNHDNPEEFNLVNNLNEEHYKDSMKSKLFAKISSCKVNGFLSKEQALKLLRIDEDVIYQKFHNKIRIEDELFSEIIWNQFKDYHI